MNTEHITVEAHTAITVSGKLGNKNQHHPACTHTKPSSNRRHKSPIPAFNIQKLLERDGDQKMEGIFFRRHKMELTHEDSREPKRQGH
jgi:hypothetical protein